MDETGSYVAEEMPGGLDFELNRLREQALMAWDKEAAALRAFGLADGLAVLEVGGGPGFVTEQLLALLPTSSITTIDRDPTMIAQATRYLQPGAGDRLQIIEASVMATGLPDDTFDFAFARLVFQHLPDPVGAAREILRVLKPSGKLVIADPDEKLHLWDPPARPEIEAIGNKMIAAQAARGGNRHIGRRLPRILKEAGFQRLDLQAIMLHSDILGIDTVMPQGKPEDMDPLVTMGIITEQEKALLAADQAEFYAGDPLAILTILMACGEKPEQL